jgi:dihydrofolate reductase
MRRIVVTNHVTLDGVMQSPDGLDSDRRGGFEHGGWTVPYVDAVMGEVLAEGMASEGALLLGRVTYQNFEAFWPHQTDGNPFTPVLNERTKYVVSTTLSEPLPWQNSRLVDGDVPVAVARLKEEDGPDLAVLGSGELGRRLFADGGALARLRLVKTVTTTTGVVIATYQPDR